MAAAAARSLAPQPPRPHKPAAWRHSHPARIIIPAQHSFWGSPIPFNPGYKRPLLGGPCVICGAGKVSSAGRGLAQALGNAGGALLLAEVDDDRPCPPEWDPMANPQSRRLPIEVIAND